jgi:hypothetical protein
MISGRGRWEGPEESEPAFFSNGCILERPVWEGSSRLWIRRLWRLGPVSVYESVFLRKRNGEWGIEWRRVCYLDERSQKRLAGRRVWRYLTVLWFWMYLVCSRWDRERYIEPGLARKRWGFLEESVPEWRRASRLRELGL